MYQIKGFSQADSSDHAQPLPALPATRQQQRRSHTIIEKCLRSVIKERMSGCLRNKGKKQVGYSVGSVGRDSRGEGTAGQGGLMRSKARDGELTERSDRYEEAEGLKGRVSTVVGLGGRKHLRTPIRHRHKDDVNNDLLVFNNSIKKTEPLRKANGDFSFISSVQIDNPEQSTKHLPKLKLNTAKLIQDQNSLPKIYTARKSTTTHRQSLLLARGMSPSALSKHLPKKTDYQALNQQLVKFLTNQKLPNPRKRKTSCSEANNSGKEVKYNLMKPLLINKDRFSTFISHLPPPLKRLIQSVLSFFQLKIYNQMPLIEYCKLLAQIKQANERAWCVLGFRFWDVNGDGVITSSDVFNVFGELNGFVEDGRMQGGLGAIGEIVNGLEVVQKGLSLLKQQLSLLNHELSMQPAPLSQPCSPTTQISHLQQILLTTPSPKYSQLLPLLSVGPQSSSSPHQHQLHLLPQDLNIKCTSSYRQCFIATEHNEQTRKMRERIDGYKVELRARRERRLGEREGRQRDGLRQGREIGYEEAVQGAMAGAVRALVWGVLGWEE